MTLSTFYLGNYSTIIKYGHAGGLVSTEGICEDTWGLGLREVSTGRLGTVGFLQTTYGQLGD